MSLSVIDLSWNNLVSSSIYHWLFNLNASLVSIDISYNVLQGPIPDAFGNMLSLKDLYLNDNSLDGGIPKSFGNLSCIHSLYLSINHLNEQLSQILQNLTGAAQNSLEILNLNQNQISGSLPDFTKFSSLKELYLGRNTLNRSFPLSFGQISNLIFLHVFSNQISGPLPDMSIFHLLKELYLSNNRLQGMLPKSIGQLSKLEILGVSSNSLEDSVIVVWGLISQKWLRTQNNFSELDISYVGISDTIPDWFWDLSPRLHFLNLSYNQISGIVPDLSLKLVDFPGIDLSSNCFNGLIPSLPPKATLVYLCKNMFSGSISHFCANNKFVGELPSSLQNCTKLSVINLGENKFAGEIPAWIGTHLTNLIILSLRQNEFYGSIPPRICHLDHIQILDLSRNNISGNIPRCLNNFTSLVKRNSSSETIKIELVSYSGSGY
ncbi:unnamed protein product [Ilex paraguariensis]|uniref:Uncharacterized protein n=1 Tax=Ilex paraguariensis TaxID=185542 RepID=A0ABC8U5D6_9AQUA